jgi:hypothetical protein
LKRALLDHFGTQGRRCIATDEGSCGELMTLPTRLLKPSRRMLPWLSPAVGSVLVSLSLFISPNGASAGEKISGYVAVQGEAEDQVSGGVDVVAQFKYKTRRVHETRAVLSLEGAYYDRSLDLEDAYVDYKPNDELRLTLGVSKKTLGLEYEGDRLERVTIHRSPIYQKMERLGIVGRQLNLRLNLSPESRKHGSTELSSALGMDGGRDLNAQLSLIVRREHFGTGTWFLVEAHKVSRYYEPMIAEAFAFWAEAKRTRLTLELFSGIDTQRTEYRRTFEEHGRVLFFGTKLELSHDYHLTSAWKLKPLAQTSFWLDDARAPERHSLQLLAGAQLRVHDVRMSLNAEVTSEKNLDHGRRQFNGEALYAEVLYSF